MEYNCKCLKEIREGKGQSMFCFVACDAQYEDLKREKTELNSEELKKKLQSMAEKEQRTLSNMVEILLKKATDNQING